MDSNNLATLIKNRRSIFPKTYTDVQISDELIMEILENANWAPNHRKTEPWRFKVIQNEARQELANYMAEWYKQNTSEESYSQKKYEKQLTKPMLSPTIIAICMQRAPDECVPEWEEVAATAMAVQNMWLTCTTHNIGSYWSSPKSIIEASEFLQLAEGEQCLGLFYMGYHNLPVIPGRRGDIKDKVKFMR
jgi:nitroreductase